jgi:hypothetical protein
MDLELDDTNVVFSALVLIKNQIFLSSFHSFLEVGKNKLELKFNDKRAWAQNFI